MKITREDRDTFYVQGTKEYMIYKDKNDRWLCDCTNWWINLDDSGKAPDCKHIKLIKSKFQL
jgi:hypothetical protein